VEELYDVLLSVWINSWLYDQVVEIAKEIRQSDALFNIWRGLKDWQTETAFTRCTLFTNHWLVASDLGLRFFQTQSDEEASLGALPCRSSQPNTPACNAPGQWQPWRTGPRELLRPHLHTPPRRDKPACVTRPTIIEG
jgi:hypothetical protein